MFEYIFIATIGISFLFLYILINRQGLAIKLFRKALIRGTKRSSYKSYIERFREHKQSNIGRNIIVQALPWLGVLALVFILSNQYFYFGTVLSGSMQPVFKRGDLVLMQTYDKKPQIGDIIMFSTTTSSEPITHRIVSIDKSGEMRTKGDANPAEDTWIVTKANIVGKAVTLGEQPITIKGLGSTLVPEAGEFSIMNKLPKGMSATVLFQQFRALQPFIIFFGTLFYFFILMETRTESNRRFNGSGRKGIKDRSKVP